MSLPSIFFFQQKLIQFNIFFSKNIFLSISLQQQKNQTFLLSHVLFHLNKIVSKGYSSDVSLCTWIYNTLNVGTNKSKCQRVLNTSWPFSITFNKTASNLPPPLGALSPLCVPSSSHCSLTIFSQVSLKHNVTPYHPHFPLSYHFQLSTSVLLHISSTNSIALLPPSPYLLPISP